MNYEVYYRNRLTGSFLSTCQSPSSIDEAREMMARAILSHIEIEDRGDDYVAGWEQLAESARKAEPGDVLEFDECAWKIEAPAAETVYVTRDRQTGTVIDEFATREAAEAAIEDYEDQDRADGNYEPDFYEVAEKTFARVTKVEQRDDAQLIDWECGGGADHVTTDFAWPGNVLESNDDGKINHGWVLLEGSSLNVGDTVTLA